VEVVSPLVGQEARTLRGLHLYHYGLSNCSQKVRIVLAEKGLPWTSHHLDLARGEHATEAYRLVNPNGLVPALIDDGTIVIESSDIMEYLDERFPMPPLRPAGENELVEMRLWVARQDSIQSPLETLSREFLFRALSPQPAAAPATIAGAVRRVEAALGEVNRHLTGRSWMAGDAYSLADIAWGVDAHRLRQMRFPLLEYPALRRWYRRVAKRPAFARGIQDHEPPELRRRLRLYTLRRWLFRSHAGASAWRNPRLLANA